MRTSFQPVCHYANQDAATAKVVVISDLHIGSHQTRYLRLWNNLLRELRKGTYNTLVINGDFGDYRASDAEEVTNAIQERINEVVGIKPPIRIHIIRGNNDTVKPLNALFVHYLLEPQSRGYFSVSDILLMGKDVAFIHGDEDLYLMERMLHSAEDVRHYWKDKVKPNGHFSHPEDYPEKIKKVDKMLRGGLIDMSDEKYQSINHVFMGHIHPKEPVLLHQCGNKYFHVTNPPFAGTTATFMELRFDEQGYAKTPRIMHFDNADRLTEYTPSRDLLTVS